MRIVTWANPSGPEPHPEEKLAPAADSKQPWVSILVGRNGSRKSLLLRFLAEAALGTDSVRLQNHPTLKPRLKTHPPNAVAARVIAISGTPFDRFRRQKLPTSTTKVVLQEAEARYYYLGLKAANGATGLSQSVRTLAHLLFDQPQRHLPTQSKNIFEFLQLLPRLSVVLRRHSSISVSRNDKDRGSLPLSAMSPEKLTRRFRELSAELNRHVREMAVDKRSTHGEREARVLSLRSVLDNRAKVRQALAKLPGNFAFSLANGVPKSHPSASSPDLGCHVNDLIEVGLVVVSHIALFRADAEEKQVVVPESDLSSGQWQLLSSMLELSLAATDNSVVFIDEPENSLHPGWQISYIDLLTRMLSGTNGCHVVVATHSPLIASGVRTKEGNVVQLVRLDSAPLGVSMVPRELTYGWEAGDVYHDVFEMKTTRAKSFIEHVDRALEIVGTGQIATEFAELKRLSVLLQGMSESLPSQDPMRQIIAAIVAVVNSQPARTKAA
ncbi:MAG: hypothetical protein CVU22_09600 [Betaproteobacteria bacterium HGW-Betaproteobacteria-16]|nr:MAG: hypothetical protein CVU22_09600 [Betaproteobacteria bacterium HGW-Betaproteobacteria-16]